MSRASVVNAVAVVVALAASVAMAARPGDAGSGGYARRADGPTPTSLVDATGVRVPVRAYARIVSGSPVADRLLVDLCEPERVAAFTSRSALGADAHRYAGRPTVDSIDSTERVAGLRPDLVLVHNVAEARRVERLREAGLTVFDLGPMHGLSSLREDIETVAAFCGDRRRGARYAETLERRLAAVSRDVQPHARRGAIYLSLYGDRLFGGTTGTSYHDVLIAAGLRDVAERAHRGWPQYTIEQLLSLDPEVVVTREGMRGPICAHPLLGDLSACERGAVVEVDGELLDAAGPGMLDAAEAVHDLVY